MKLAYADPPYPGQAKRHYGDHPDYAGEVDHAQLVRDLVADYDGFVLHTSAPALYDVLDLFVTLEATLPRVMAWVKPFATFKRNVPVAYAWEPVIISPCRKPQVGRGIVTPLRDWFSAGIVLNGGSFAGAKPRELCWWAFECLGADPEDDLADLYPGTGAVAEAWSSWRSQLPLAYEQAQEQQEQQELQGAKCDRCGRRSIVAAEGNVCGMPQPNGSPCHGTFRQEAKA